MTTMDGSQSRKSNKALSSPTKGPKDGVVNKALSSRPKDPKDGLVNKSTSSRPKSPKVVLVSKAPVSPVNATIDEPVKEGRASLTNTATDGPVDDSFSSRTKAPKHGLVKDLYVELTNAATENPVNESPASPTEATTDEPVNEAPASLTDPTINGLVDEDLPKTFDAFWTWYPDPTQQGKRVDAVIGSYAIKIRRSKPKDLSTAHRQVVFNILKALFESDFEKVSHPEDLQKVKPFLLLIMGESGLKDGPVAFPDPYPVNASFLLDRVTALQNFVDESDEAEPSSPTTPTMPKRPGTGQKRKREVRRRLPDMENPTVKSALHNLVYNSARRLKVADRSLCTPHNVVGNNGLKIGAWWPLRLCVLRDGGHGSSQGGIAGDYRGARSIMVGGGYEGLDEDKGEVIYYCGSGSHLNTDPITPHLTAATKNMQQSKRTGSPIRVFRNDKATTKYAPSVGIRYDGLYKITKEERLPNKLGGAFLQFELTRVRGQSEMDFNRPNAADKKLFDRLKASI